MSLFVHLMSLLLEEKRAQKNLAWTVSPQRVGGLASLLRLCVCVCVKRLVWVAGLPQNRIREELPLLGAGTKQQAAKFGEGRGGEGGIAGRRGWGPVPVAMVFVCFVSGGGTPQVWWTHAWTVRRQLCLRSGGTAMSRACKVVVTTVQRDKNKVHRRTNLQRSERRTLEDGGNRSCWSIWRVHPISPSTDVDGCMFA